MILAMSVYDKLYWIIATILFSLPPNLQFLKMIIFSKQVSKILF